MSAQLQTGLLGILLIVTTAAAFWPAVQGGFIWDDDAHVLANPHIVGPLGLKEIWTTSGGVYYPLVLTTFWVQYRLWGADPAPYHLVNIALHAASALVLWRVLRRLKVPGAWLGAALWAVHPVQVESVAWITELKNIQSGLFYLLSMACFLRWLERSRTGNGGASFYTLALLFGALAMLSKTSTVMLPVLLGLCWWWQEREWRPRNILRLLPILALSAMLGIWTVWEQKFHSGALGPDWNQTWPEKVAIAGRIFWFYLEKLAWPDALSFIYPRWNINGGSVLAYMPSVGAAVLLGILWRKRHGKLRPAFFAFAYFAISLFPVSNFLDAYFFRFSFVGDHFQYLPSMGPLALAGGLMATFVVPLSGRRWAALLVCVALIAGLAGLSRQQSSIYKNNLTLWRDTLEKNPDAWLAHVNLGAELDAQGRGAEAIVEYQAALKIYPDDIESRNNLATHQAERGNLAAAIAEWEYVVALNPDHALAHNNLAIALLQLGKAPDAFKHWEEALRVEPNMIGAHYNYGLALSASGQWEDASAHLTRAIELEPDLAEAYEALAGVFRKRKEFATAIQTYRKAIDLNPRAPGIKADLAFLLATSPDPNDRRGDEAVTLAEQALIELGRPHPRVLDALAAAYAEAGRYKEAADVARRTLSLLPPNEDSIAEGLRGRLALYEKNQPYRER